MLWNKIHLQQHRSDFFRYLMHIYAKQISFSVSCLATVWVLNMVLTDITNYVLYGSFHHSQHLRLDIATVQVVASISSLSVILTSGEQDNFFEIFFFGSCHKSVFSIHLKKDKYFHFY